ncbi:HlyD family secretion protein [Microbulbifer sp.]|uniref:HlyD family secretion protein n=1 Tax=Microbulbifer sp. TaxID=1908541 RepID=UPI002585F319|nr:HlyD family secretion protein [Microbulbifer sp.]
MRKLYFIFFTCLFGVQCAVAKDDFASLVGRVEYKKQDVIVSRVDGYLREVGLNAGERANPGEILATVESFDPSFNPQIISSPMYATVVSEVFVKQGEPVKRHQPIMRLTRNEDLSVVARAYGDNRQYISIGKQVTVHLDPGLPDLTLEGIIESISSIKGKALPVSEVTIGVNVDSCRAAKICRDKFRENKVIVVSVSK